MVGGGLGRNRWRNHRRKQTHAVSWQTMPERCRLRSWVAHDVCHTVLAARLGAKNVDGWARGQGAQVGQLPHKGCRNPDLGLLRPNPALLLHRGMASAMPSTPLLRNGGKI